MKVELDFKSAMTPPEKSGLYIVWFAFYDRGFFGYVHYSKKHDAWNTYDREPDGTKGVPDARNPVKGDSHVAMWAELPEVLEC